MAHLHKIFRKKNKKKTRYIARQDSSPEFALVNQKKKKKDYNLKRGLGGEGRKHLTYNYNFGWKKTSSIATCIPI